ncbi:MAG: hypothetical protein IPP14_12205 [Planctomycetes bacterium]|nr:hypothetical protein [Planctomycetota bacterium]
MARYHSVRPKHHSIPSPAAPAQPKPAQTREQDLATQNLQLAADEIYAARNGLELDASIARWKKLLAIHDRELEVVAASDGSKPHRWTISPSIAFRVDKLLRELLDNQLQLKAECRAQALQILSELMRQQASDSLCPPKRPEPAPEAATQPPARAEKTATPAQAPAPAISSAA